MRAPSVISLVAVAALWGMLMSACHPAKRGDSTSKDAMIDSLIPVASHSFRIEYYKTYKLIKVYKPSEMEPAKYVLCSKNVSLPEYLKGAVRIETPVSRIACLSTTHVGALQLLNSRGRIAAAANTDLICDSEVSAMIKDGKIKNAGHDYQPDYEVIAGVRPQILFSDGESGSAGQTLQKLKALHISVASSRDYFEQDPLARAEWIKFFAAFVDKEKMADSIFNKVKADYGFIRNSTAKTGERPTVFCNVPYNGIWYMPCGKNYVARLFADAGSTFLWQKDEPINGLNLTLNFEQVYERAANADFWMNPGVVSSLAQLSDQDTKFKLFKAYKTGQVYNCTNRLSPGGGMDMWETGTFRPDLVLRDLSLIFHGGSSQDLYYYKKIK